MQPLSILILSDGRPGHYHLAEGVAAAIARRRPVAVQSLRINRRRIVPGRVAARAVMLGLSDAAILRHGYAVDAATLPKAALVVSAGGETTAANAAAAHALGADNIYCGTLKYIAPERFSLIVTSYDRFRDTPRHLVALKPSHIDPDSIGRDGSGAGWSRGEPPRLCGLLIGGNAGKFQFDDADWQALYELMDACTAQHGTRWIVSTSRRTPEAVADAVAAIAARPDGPIAEFIDYRIAGPGTLGCLFARVDAVVVTEDSSTMLSEAVCARLPVVGVSPERHEFKDDEREYRAFMLRKGWCRSLLLAEATPDALLAAFRAVVPLAANPLDDLADAIGERLPRLFTAPAQGMI